MAALHPSLPRNPTLAYPSSQLIAFTSSSTPSNSKLICSICRSKNAKYTCPGCTIHTCSLTCSTSHKSQTGCTGQRNKVAYIPLNEYGWGKMMDDYVFLEDVSRKVGDWGKEIVRGGYSFGHVKGRDNRGRGRGRGRGRRGRGGGGGGSGRTKRDVLKLQLEARDIDMDLLPIGMERRKLNQSSWDFKNQTALLTIEFKFHKPLNPLAPSQPHEQPFTLLTHRNNIKSSLLALLRSHMNTDGKNHSRKESSYPEWAKCLIINPDSDKDPESFTNPQCVMQALISHQLRGIQQSAYYSFDPSQALINLLRDTQFVEFPTIEIWEDFQGILVDAQGVVRQPEDERQPKRRKMNPKAGRLAINGLLGDYGSEDDDQKVEGSNVLAALDNYAESSDEAELDPAVLLDLMRQARGDEPWAVEEDEIVDWGDYDE